MTTLLTPDIKESMMDDPKDRDILKKSALYQEFLAERDEILRHKWIESEKAGCDIGWEKALLDWIVKHRSAWRTGRRRNPVPRG